jgi:hypothetical protein
MRMWLTNWRVEIEFGNNKDKMKSIFSFKGMVVATLAVLCWLTGPSKAVGAGTVTTSSSTSGSTAYLSGIINNISSSTRAYFEYGADVNYGSFTSTHNFNPPGSQTVYATVMGLAPGTYHYRILVIDNTGVATGSDMTFTIGGPSVTTLAVSVFGPDNIILNGFVNPNGVATTAYFEYGTNTSYGKRTSVTNLAAGSITSFVYNSINGLTTNPASHFRIVASNSVGVSFGADMTFSNQPQSQGLMAIPQAIFWNAGNTNPPVIQLQGAGTPPLTYSIVRTPRFGTIVTNVPGGFHTADTGKCQYMPYAFNTFKGEDSFTFKVSNGTNSSTEATVNITALPVNHAPHAENQVVKVLKNISYNGYLSGDDDADYPDPYSDLANYSDPNHRDYHYSPATPNLTYTILSNPTNGTLATNFPAFTYTPNTNYVGTDSFTFKVNDGVLDSTNIGTVSIIVATNVGAIRPGFDKFSFGRADDQGFPVSLTGTNADWLGRDLLLQFSTNKFPGNYFTQFYANNNGNLTFASTNANYVGQVFPTMIGPMIAPFWADVLTTDARSGVMTYGMQYVGGRLAVGVTWTNVMTYGNTTNTNSFQVVLIDRSDVQVGNFEIEFNYDKIQWLNGTASAGTYPSIGFDQADGFYYNLPGAGTTNLLDTSTNGLIHVPPPAPGRYSFRMYQPLALGQSIVALANTTNVVTLNPSTFFNLQGTFAMNYAIVAGPTHGTLSGTGANRTYQPNTNYAGPDGFTFSVSDGGRYSTNTVTISVVGLPGISNTTATVAATGSVTLNATGYPDYGDTTFYVKYGTTTNYGSMSVLWTLAAGSGTNLLASILETNQGAALSLNGVNQYLKVPATISNDFTIEFWMLYPRLTSVVEGQWYQGLGLVDGYVPGKTNDFGLSIGNGKVLFGVGGPDTTIASRQLLDGNWHHVAATRVQTNGAMTLYIDGVLAASTNGSTATLNDATNLMIGCLQTLSNFFAGSLDEVRLWNLARSPVQIQLTMNQSLSGTNAGLLACYHLDDLPGTNAADASGNGKTGSIINNPDWTSGSVPIGQLIPGTTYHYQIVAVNAAGTNSTSDLIFTMQGTNAVLASLSLGTGPPSPFFTPTILSYSSMVANSVSNMDIVAVSADTNATIQMQANGGGFSAPGTGVISNRVVLNRFKPTP